MELPLMSPFVVAFQAGAIAMLKEGALLKRYCHIQMAHETGLACLTFQVFVVFEGISERGSPDQNVDP